MDLICYQDRHYRNKKYTVGIETYEKANLNDQIKAALNNAQYFKEKCTCKGKNASFILRTTTKVGP